MITIMPCPHGLGYLHIHSPGASIDGTCLMSQDAITLANELLAEVERQEQAGKCTCCCHAGGTADAEGGVS